MDNFNQIITIEILLSIIVGVSILTLGFFVYLKNKKGWTHRLFLLLCLNIVMYIIVNFISLHPPSGTPDNQLFWIRVVMFTTSFIGPILVLLVHTFPRPKIELHRRYLVLLFGLMTLSAIASLSPLVFKGINYPEGKPIPVPGPGILIFFLDFVGLFILSFIILGVRYFRAQGIEKKRMLLLLLGVVGSFSLMGITTVIFVVILKTSDFVVFGPLSSIFLIISISYAIVKYKLFDARIIATEIFTFIVWVVFSLNLITSDSAGKLIVNILLLLLLIIFGLLLIRGVRREIEELRRLSEAKSEFVSIASHQLRTPLTAIKGFLSMLKEEKNLDIKTQKDWLEKAYESNERLIRLVSDLLDISRIERGSMKYEFKETDIVSIITDVVAELKIPAQKKNITLRLEKPKQNIPPLKLDGEKIRQVLMNLIDNAMNYTEKGGVTIRLIYLDQLNRVQIMVKDTGVGMSKEDIQNLFNIFSRGANVKKTHVEGMGLGLYIADKIVKAHGGKIWATSEGLHKGSTFYVELPVQL